MDAGYTLAEAAAELERRRQLWELEFDRIARRLLGVVPGEDAADERGLDPHTCTEG